MKFALLAALAISLGTALKIHANPSHNEEAPADAPPPSGETDPNGPAPQISAEDQAKLDAEVAKLTKQLKKEQKKEFHKIDKNGDGKIVVEELVENAKKIMKDDYNSETQEDTKKYFKIADTNGDGGITLKEYITPSSEFEGGEEEPPAEPAPAAETAVEPAAQPAAEPAPAH